MTGVSVAAAIIIAAIILLIGYSYITAKNSLGCQFGEPNCVQNFFFSTSLTASTSISTITTSKTTTSIITTTALLCPTFACNTASGESSTPGDAGICTNETEWKLYKQNYPNTECMMPHNILNAKTCVSYNQSYLWASTNGKGWCDEYQTVNDTCFYVGGSLQKAPEASCKAIPISCGAIFSHRNNQVPYSNNLTADITCFENAVWYNGSRASLTLIYNNTNFEETHNFTSFLNETIQDTVTNYSISSRYTKTGTYICAQLGISYNKTQNRSGLLISSCSGESDIFIPYNRSQSVS